MANDEEQMTASLEFRTGETQGDEDADRMTRHMLKELRESGVGADLVRNKQVAEGSKGAELVEAGKLLLMIAPVAMPYLVSVLHEWLGRNNQRSIKLKTANGLEFEATGGMSVKEIADLVATLGGGTKATS